MKVIFICSSCYIVYMMRFNERIRQTYEPAMDNFRVPFLILPCFLLALVWNEYFSVSEVGSTRGVIILCCAFALLVVTCAMHRAQVLWAFSIYLEAVAIVPQLIVVHRYARQQDGFVENLTSHYVVALGGYRAMYLVNWVYRILTEPGYRNWIVWVSGVVQTAIYCDFFYYYITAHLEKKEMKLPI